MPEEPHLCSEGHSGKKIVIVTESGLKVSQLVSKMYTEISCKYLYCLMNLQQLGVRGLAITRVDCVWNVMAHAQKSDFVFRRNGRVNLNRRGRQFSRLLAAEVCASAVVMLDTQNYEVVWRVLATHSIRQFPLHFPSRASPCAITFQLDATAHSGYLRQV
jgi:hypothetical protein